ncbi:hypothetical protein K7957_18695 [Sphingomonas yunnanensis]|uniref:hypothetical protein n=1 Tax=Sphingomonas yunnanensis TaxID=310400 RepID=UPI001CA5FE77|nr:hypothetical protein [Sphingomonas yunnanensis]MBY9064968.1 hypothetical protein [Sphingomonas yunnanensis]
MGYNQYNIRKPFHAISLTSDNIIKSIHPGGGLDCSDPLDAVPSQLDPFYDEAAQNSLNLEGELIGNVDILKSSTSFIETKDYRSMADALRVNMRLSYGFASASAAYSQTKEKVEQGKIVLAVISSTVTGPGLPEKDLHWKGLELSELEKIDKIPDRLARQDNFVQQFGSHYVSAVELGYRLAISGEYQSLDETARMKFSAAFKASFTGGGGAASISAEHEEILRSERTSIRSELMCGDVIPDRPLLTTTYDEVMSLLRALREGEIVLKRGPVRALVRSYYASLIEHPASRDSLAPSQQATLLAPYGVPSGTVIAWFPPPEAIVDEDGVRRLLIPDGWALADGSNGTPNLSDRFIRGTIDFTAIGAHGGATSHSHKGWTQAPEGAQLRAGGGDQPFARRDTVYQLQIEEADHAPPFVLMIYLVKT